MFIVIELTSNSNVLRNTLVKGCCKVSSVHIHITHYTGPWYETNILSIRTRNGA